MFLFLFSFYLLGKIKKSFMHNAGDDNDGGDDGSDEDVSNERRGQWWMTGRKGFLFCGLNIHIEWNSMLMYTIHKLILFMILFCV